MSTGTPAPSMETIADLSKSLERIAQKKMKQDVIRHWFQGNEPYFDLFANTLEEKVIWFQFTFRGNSICWAAQDPQVRTGVTTDMAVSDVSFYSASKTIKLDAELNRTFLDFTKTMFLMKGSEEPFASIRKLLETI